MASLQIKNFNSKVIKVTEKANDFQILHHGLNLLGPVGIKQRLSAGASFIGNLSRLRVLEMNDPDAVN